MKRITLLTLVFFLLSTAGVVDAQDRTLFKFDSIGTAQQWQTVNDGVMGGVSTGRYRINENGRMEFFGNLSLANNGGFASVRARSANFGLKPGDWIVVRVKGDGRKYSLNLYTQSNLGGYSYRQSFLTKKDAWIEVAFPVEKFVATWRGRVFQNERLDPSSVAGLGFLLGDKKAGPFKLEVDWVKVRSQP